MTVTTGAPTAAIDVNVRMEHYVTLSLDPVSALLDTEAGDVRSNVKLALMEMGVNGHVSARMGPSVIM